MNYRIAYWWMLLLVVGSTLGGCGRYASGETMEQARNQYFTKMGIPLPHEPQGITIFGNRDFGQGVVTLYENPRYRSDMWYQVLWRENNGWYSEFDDNGGDGFVNNTTPYIRFAKGLFSRGSIVFGRRIDSSVARVEVTFTTVVTSTTNFQGEVFAIVGMDNVDYCSVQVYNAQNILLARLDKGGFSVDESFQCK